VQSSTVTVIPNLNLRTNGTKQTVQIDSKGEIRGVSITMTKT